MKNVMLSVAFALGAAVALGGCGRDHHDDHRDDQPPPPVAQQAPPVVGQPPPVVSDDGSVVYVEPPPPQVEVIPAAPGPDFVWVSGEWGYMGGSWQWNAGHYDHPPHPGAQWEPGTYSREGNGYRHQPGHWR